MIEYLFITPAPLVKIDGAVTTPGASARLGSLVPARALMRLGYDARTYSVAGDAAPAEEALRSAKRVVFGEMFPGREGGWAETAATYRRLFGLVENPGARVAFSLADDHFDEPPVRELYAEVLPRCRAATAVSAQLADTVRGYTSRPVHVAPEPCEGSRAPPHAIAARRLAAPFRWLARRVGLTTDLWRVRLLWFGYPENLGPLLELAPALEDLAREYPLFLTCVTKPVPEVRALVTPPRTDPEARFRVHFVPWHPFVLDEVMAYSDVVLIPSDYRNASKRAKSPNRLVAGLNAGRFVVAHPLPAYAPYADFAWIGQDLCAGVRWAIRHPREVVERIVRGQAYVDQHHSLERVARFWLDVFESRN